MDHIDITIVDPNISLDSMNVTLGKKDSKKIPNLEFENKLELFQWNYKKYGEPKTIRHILNKKTKQKHSNIFVGFIHKSRLQYFFIMNLF